MTLGGLKPMTVGIKVPVKVVEDVVEEKVAFPSSCCRSSSERGGKVPPTFSFPNFLRIFDAWGGGLFSADYLTKKHAR